MGMVSMPSFLMYGAAWTWALLTHPRSVLFMRLMKRSASMSADMASPFPGNSMAGRPEASLIAFAVSERFCVVTPVDPPMKTASYPFKEPRYDFAF